MKAPAWGPAQAAAYEEAKKAQVVRNAAPDLLRAARHTLEALENFDTRAMPVGLLAGISMLTQAVAKAEGTSA